VARHRSPQGRRAHLSPPLPAIAPSWAGGAHRSIPVTQLTSSLPARFVATAVAGSALAAVGQHALAQTLPETGDGTNVLRLGVQQLFAPDADLPADPATVTLAPSAVTAPLTTLAPVLTAPAAPQTAVVDAAELVKASDIQRQLTEAGVRAAAEQSRAAEAAAAEAARKSAEAAAADRVDASPGEEATTPRAGKKPDTSSLSDSAIQMVTGRVTSGFGGRWGTRHEGLDIAAPIGTPIRVPFAGTVVDSGPASGFGLWVRVRHGDGTVTTYGHVNRSFVAKGQQVKAGQKIAEVGNRGHSTGPHLHIEVTTPAGTKINPKPWLDGHGVGY
jgi:murein DD-endopeptidase MepM/ murein hydrolase activator NlpD